MAHSRIFQLTDECLFKCGYTADVITESDFYEMDSFLGPIADYVSDECNRREDFDWLVEFLAKAVDHDPVFKDYLAWHFAEGDNETAEAYITFKRGFKRSYFEKGYETFLSASKAVTMDLFMGSDTNFSLWMVKQTFGDKFGFYVWTEDSYPIVLDDFLRRLPDDEEITCWLGGTVDYHH